MSKYREFRAEPITKTQYALEMKVYEQKILLASFGFVYINGKPNYPCYNYCISNIAEFNNELERFVHFVEMFERSGRPFGDVDSVSQLGLF